MKLTKIFSVAAPGALALGLLAGCSGSDSVDLRFIPAKESDNQKWGMVDKDGNFLVTDEFENVPTWGYGGVFSVEEGSKGLRTLYHIVDGKAKMIKDFDNLKDCGRCAEGLLPVVRENERIRVIDAEGNEKFEVEPVDGKEVVYAGFYRDGRMVFSTSDGKFGFFDKDGKVAVKPVYDGVIAGFEKGRAILYKERKEGPDSTLTYALSVIDRNGKVEGTINGKFDYGQVYDKGVILRSDKTYLLYDFKGERTGKLPSKVGRLGDANGDLVVYFSDEGNAGVMTFDGEVVVRPKYDYITWLETGNMLCVKDDNKGIDLVNRKGDIVRSVDYSAAFVFESFGVVLHEDKDFYFFNDKLEGETKNYVREIGLSSRSFDEFVRSDYIYPAAIAATMYNTFFDKAVFADKGIRFGASPSQVERLTSEDPQDYIYRNTLNWNIESTNTYTLKGLLEFDNNIGKREYTTEYENYFGYTFSREVFRGYAFNNKAKVSLYGLQLLLDHHNKAMSVVNELLKQFDANTKMKKVASGKSGALYVEGTTLYMVAANDSNNRSVFLVQTPDSPATRNDCSAWINKDIDEEAAGNARPKVVEAEVVEGEVDEVEVVAVADDSVAPYYY